MKKIGIIFILISFVLSANVYTTNQKGIKVWDKEAIDCGTFFGTKCVGDGDGCDPKVCPGEER